MNINVMKNVHSHFIKRFQNWCHRNR